MNLAAAPESVATAPLRLGRPRIDEGADIHRLVAECRPLDLNSAYLYLLLAHHFADTCIVARSGERAVGFVSAYQPPGRADTLFVWQVAVAPEMRGRGLAGRMLRALLRRDALRAVTRLETTVSPGNAASRMMFRKLADYLGAPLAERALFQAEHFGPTAHEDERLVAIGPFRTKPMTSEDP
jgi:L-2,4-diaminobutyric acid acetyltransferase